MTHASLFSGIGGFDLAAEWAGWQNIFHCEWNPFGQKVLKHHFPNSISYNDITKTDFTIHRGQVDILTGGFPCQPYSSAGKRLGKADERHLFPHMLRCIKEVKPRWVIGENVRGLVSWNGGMVFDEVCDDLEREGYEVQPFLIPAASVNAPHQRQRIWFVAFNNTNSNCKYERTEKYGFIQAKNEQDNRKRTQTIYNEFMSNGNNEYVTNTKCIGIQRHRRESSNIKFQSNEFNTHNSKRQSIMDWKKFPTKSPICGGDDGLPRELDNITFPKWRNESIKAYGNAIVPQVAYQIFKTINDFESLSS
jgi:DNA (cytosine-5)-methyltransferase 1